MSHFVVGVIVPADADLDPYIEGALQPYSENIEVEPYSRDCYCVGRDARTRLNEKVNEKFPDAELAEFRRQMAAEERERRAKLGMSPTDEQFAEFHEACDLRWRELTKEFFDAREAYRKKLTRTAKGLKKTDPKCSACKGSGKEETRYNPDSKWDWYVVGGRWAQYFDGFTKTKANKNAAPVEQVIGRLENDPKFLPPFSLVSVDGEWVERGEMGWWGVVRDEKEAADWRNLAIATLKKAPKGSYVVAVDCHI